MNKNQSEIYDIKYWFDTYYKQHEEKYRRLIYLGKQTDDNKDPQKELKFLYLEAEEKRKRIQSLEDMLDNE